GNIYLQLGFNKTIPNKWLGENISGKKILCLAGAGGMQAPILAAAGAMVTVLDISENMLAKDMEISKRENLGITTLHGNMCDLSCFDNETFDIIINPVSLIYVPDVLPVFSECYRVLKHGGTFIMAAPNPIAYVCDYVDDKSGKYYKAVNRMPYISTDYDSESDWIEFGHTMESYIGGQLSCGFIISGYIEHQMDDITELYFITKADKK
ncbi:MAG: class I SAM-dependent methyltransferase, partial [Desulfovibrionales bacterium]|nr:class I SAM-dependent methyltransferase [Desulfovibrionales bacterium]